MSISDIANRARETLSDAGRAVHSRATTLYLTAPVALSTLLAPGTAEAHPSNDFIHVHEQDIVAGARIPIVAVAAVVVAGAVVGSVREMRAYRNAARDFEETGYGSLREERNRVAGGVAFYTSVAGAVATWSAPLVRDLVNQYL